MRLMRPRSQESMWDEQKYSGSGTGPTGKDTHLAPWERRLAARARITVTPLSIAWYCVHDCVTCVPSNLALARCDPGTLNLNTNLQTSRALTDCC